MITLEARAAASALGVERVVADVTGVSIDTRTLRPGDLFVALRGEHFDGHVFVPAAFAVGAAGAVVELGAPIAGDPAWEAPGSSGRIYRVGDTVVALGSLARAVRRSTGVTVVAVTGSVGKTGTKDLIRAMASRVRRVAATAANENNEVGVPLTLLAMAPDTELAVVEMGMRGLGQIAALAAVAEPDVAVVTKVAPVHLALVGTVADVAAAKAELIYGLSPGGVAVVPAGEALLDHHLRAAARRVVRFSFGRAIDGADVWGRATPGSPGRSHLFVHWPQGELDIDVPFSGLHRLENAVAAIAACWAAGLPLEECILGLTDVDFTPSRGDEHEVEGILILDHSYNSNPAATMTALEDLAERAASRGGRAVAILGDMLELGESADAYHEQVGRHAAVVGVDRLVGVGDKARLMVAAFRTSVARQNVAGADAGLSAIDAESGSTSWAEGVNELESQLPDLKREWRSGDVVLIKGSRAIGLDRLVSRLVGGVTDAEPDARLGGLS